MTAPAFDTNVGPDTGIDALTVGRVGVDLYPEQSGVPLSQVRSFSRFLGGTATNVAVAAARLGNRSAVLTKVGADEFGTYVRTALQDFGVDPRYVGTSEKLRTPLAFCALDPPDDPPLLFYRQPTAPDLTLIDADVPWQLVVDVSLFWVTGTGASVQPARDTQLAMLTRRGRPAGRWTVLDLDWRPMFWTSADEAQREYGRMLEHVNVTVGNRAEVEVAVGTSDPELAASRLLERGVEIAIVKLGSAGVLIRTEEGQTIVPPCRVQVVNGLGAGDAFGGALVHGLLAGWEPARCVEFANAAGALVAARLACADAMPTFAELTEFASHHDTKAIG